jgi:hypothetical protein
MEIIGFTSRKCTFKVMKADVGRVLKLFFPKNEKPINSSKLTKALQ